MAAKEETLHPLIDKPYDKSFEASVRDWSGSRLSPSSGYYAGRGPNRGDLNSDHLEALWKGIVDNIGQEAARHFVLMVESLEDMSASAFLVSFQHYWHSKFRWDNRQQERGDGAVLDARGPALETQAMCAIFSAFGRGNRDPEMDRFESRSIKMPFLRNHVATQKKEECLLDIHGLKW
jgi:hypothetical protein